VSRLCDTVVICARSGSADDRDIDGSVLRAVRASDAMVEMYNGYSSAFDAELTMARGNVCQATLERTFGGG
jgi:hypothetical protein